MHENTAHSGRNASAAFVTDVALPKDWLKCCFTSTETIGLMGTGAQDAQLDFHTAPEL